MLKIINYEDGDWVTVVKDNKIVHENHSIDGKTMLDILNIDYDTERFTGTEDEWYEYVKQFSR